MAKDKRLKAAYESFDAAKLHALPEAIQVVKGNAKAKFDETVEISMNLGIDPRHADQMVRGLVCRRARSSSTAASPPRT